MCKIRSSLLIIILLFTILFSFQTVHAGDISWESQNYTTWVMIGEDLGFAMDWYDYDIATGSTTPLSAHAQWESIEYPGWKMDAYSGFTDTSMYIECNPLRCKGANSFTGTYIATDPYFYYNLTAGHSLSVTDLTTGTTLNSPGSSYYVPTTVGNEIQVKMGMSQWEHISGNHLTVDYSMASVAPEPISSTLFIVGGTLLGFRRLRKNKE